MTKDQEQDVKRDRLVINARMAVAELVLDCTDPDNDELGAVDEMIVRLEAFRNLYFRNRDYLNVKF